MFALCGQVHQLGEVLKPGESPYDSAMNKVRPSCKVLLSLLAYVAVNTVRAFWSPPSALGRATLSLAAPCSRTCTTAFFTR